MRCGGPQVPAPSPRTPFATRNRSGTPPARPARAVRPQPSPHDLATGFPSRTRPAVRPSGPPRPGADPGARGCRPRAPAPTRDEWHAPGGERGSPSGPFGTSELSPTNSLFVPTRSVRGAGLGRRQEVPLMPGGHVGGAPSPCSRSHGSRSSSRAGAGVGSAVVGTGGARRAAMATRCSSGSAASSVSRRARGEGVGSERATEQSWELFAVYVRFVWFSSGFDAAALAWGARGRGFKSRRPD